MAFKEEIDPIKYIGIEHKRKEAISLVNKCFDILLSFASGATPFKRIPNRNYLNNHLPYRKFKTVEKENLVLSSDKPIYKKVAFSNKDYKGKIDQSGKYRPNINEKIELIIDMSIRNGGFEYTQEELQNICGIASAIFESEEMKEPNASQSLNAHIVTGVISMTLTKLTQPPKPKKGKEKA